MDWYYKPVPPARVGSSSKGMSCPKCGGATVVTDTRPRGEALRRRRCCLSCDLRFSTIEIIGNPPKRYKLDAVHQALTVLANRISELEYEQKREDREF